MIYIYAHIRIHIVRTTEKSNIGIRSRGSSNRTWNLDGNASLAPNRIVHVVGALTRRKDRVLTYLSYGETNSNEIHTITLGRLRSRATRHARKSRSSEQTPFVVKRITSSTRFRSSWEDDPLCIFCSEGFSVAGQSEARRGEARQSKAIKVIKAKRSRTGQDGTGQDVLVKYTFFAVIVDFATLFWLNFSFAKTLSPIDRAIVDRSGYARVCLRILRKNKLWLYALVEDYVN